MKEYGEFLVMVACVVAICFCVSRMASCSEFRYEKNASIGVHSVAEGMTLASDSDVSR